MPTQPSLEGFDPPAAPSDRLFFALMPDERAAARADQMAHDLGLQYGAKPRKAAREKFHVTLFHVGVFVGLPEQTVARACDLAATLHAAPFDIRFDRLVSFAGSPNRLPYVLLCDASSALGTFQAALQSTMLKNGLVHGANHRQFTAHLTLLYGHQPLPEQVIDEPLAWAAREFVLIRSLIGRGQYQTLGRWPLRG